MKIGILYASKTGTTAKAAHRLAALLRERGLHAEAVDLSAQTPPEALDAVALGGSIRMGRWHRRALRYAKTQEATLLQKPLALFACRCGKEDLRKTFAAQIGQALTDHAVFLDGVGGEMLLENQKGLDRFVVKMVQKNNNRDAIQATGLLEDRLTACADALKQELAK